MTDMKTALTTAAIAKLILSRAQTALNQAKTDLDSFLDPGDRKRVIPPGATRTADCATISYSDPEPSWRVTDEAAFTTWMKTNRPQSIIETVRTSDRDALLKDIDTGHLNGEIPDGVDLIPGRPVMAITQSQDQAANLIAALDAGLIDLPTGILPTEPTPPALTATTETELNAA